MNDVSVHNFPAALAQMQAKRNAYESMQRKGRKTPEHITNIHLAQVKMNFSISISFNRLQRIQFRLHLAHMHAHMISFVYINKWCLFYWI